MAGGLIVKRMESDTLQGLADLMETMLNVTYNVSVVAPFQPTLSLVRGRQRNIAGHILLYGVLN